MTVQLKKVPGGYELFIPDEMAHQAGLREGVELQAEVLAEQLLVRQPEFVETARAALIAKITPESLHDPHEPYAPPASVARVER